MGASDETTVADGGGFLGMIMKGRQHLPRRVVLYGPDGVGKTTWASMSPKPIIVQTEDGAADIDVDAFPVADSFESFMEFLSSLRTERHEYKTVIIDSLDWLERLIWARVCEDENVDTIDKIGYAKGYGYATRYWGFVFDMLNSLRAGLGMMIICIAHAKIEKFESPDTDNFDRYSPNLHKTICPVWREWADEVFFARFVVDTVKEDKGFNQKVTKGIGSGERVIHTTERPGYVAKTRLQGAPETLPMDFRIYQQLIDERRV